MAYTIATHNGTSAHRAHNIRVENVVEKQEHIQENGRFEIWHDEAPREAYERIFGDYVKEYNEKQKRPERRITDYYKDVCNDKKRNAVYEMIVSVGNKDEHPTEQQCRELLHEFVYGNPDINYPSWEKRNPNLELIGAYYHADEQGVPHLHIDYVPVAHGYKRGMWAQNGLDKALREMGYEHHGNHATPQIQWQKKENERFEGLCNWHGLEIEHPMADKGVKHIHTEAYKAKAECNEAIKEYTAQIDDLQATIDNMNVAYDSIIELVDTSNSELQEILQNQDKVKRSIEHDSLELSDIREQLKGLGQLKEKVDKLIEDYEKLAPKVKEKLERQEIAIDRFKNVDWNYYMEKWKESLQQEKEHGMDHER